MAHLIPVPASDIRVEYHSPTRELKLNAKGVLFERVLQPFFRQERWAGGFRFSLVAFPDSEAVAEGSDIVEFPFEAKTFVLRVNLPLTHFNNTTVLVDTASETANVKINYLGWPTNVPVTSASAQADENLGTNTGDVLTPIRLGLVGGHTLQITAEIPKASGDGHAWVDISYNKKFLRIDDANIAATGPNTTITWTVEWAEFPTGKNNPQLFEVITKKWNGILGPESHWSKIVQGYIITGQVLTE